MLNDREKATVLAALSMWQRHGLRSCEEAHGRGQGSVHWLDNIATAGGRCAPLSEKEIDALCERLGAPLPEVKVSACCHATLGYDAYEDSNGENCGGPYDYSACMECGEEAGEWDGESPPTNPDCDAIKHGHAVKVEG